MLAFWYVVVGLISIFLRSNAHALELENGIYKFQQDKALCRSLRSVEMANKIRRIPLRIEGLFL